MRNKIFTKIILTTLLVTFLTFNVGKVTRVSATVSTAAIAGTAFILTGAIYLSYIALTQGTVALPAADDLHNWLGSIGRKVSQYPSGSEAYQDIYQGLLSDPTANVIDGVWTWTQDRLKSFANDFSDTRIIQNITSYVRDLNIYTQITNHFDYPFEIKQIEYIDDGSVVRTIPQYIAMGNEVTFGTPVITEINGNAYITFEHYTQPLRNVLKSNGYYGVQSFNGQAWQNETSIRTGIYVNDILYGQTSNATLDAFFYRYVQSNVNVRVLSYPPLTQADTYIESTGEVIAADEVISTEVVKTPAWLDPDNNNRPIIPWVPIPNIPFGVPTPPGYTNIPQWGFPLAELLDLLEELAEGLIEIGAIAELINEFAGLHGDTYYLEYNDGDTNYYTYYQPTIFDNDTEYVTYNINVSEQEDVIPVDLNTISVYTQNRYLEQIKDSAIAGSSMLRDLAVFWYDVDPEVTYIVFGCCILVLIGAFTGKLGHS